MGSDVVDQNLGFRAELQKKRKRKEHYCFDRKLNKTKLRIVWSQIFAELTKLALAYRKVSLNHEKLATHLVEVSDSAGLYAKHLQKTIKICFGARGSQ